MPGDVIKTVKLQPWEVVHSYIYKQCLSRKDSLDCLLLVKKLIFNISTV